MASPSQIKKAAYNAGFRGNALVIATAIALAESGGNEKATHKNTNRSVDYGAWQINSVHGDLLKTGDWSNLDDNARMAYQVYRNAGGHFTPWATYNHGSYKSHLVVANLTSTAGTTGQTTGNHSSVLSDLNAVGSAITNPGGALAVETAAHGVNPIVNAVDPLKNLGTLTAFLLDPSFWKRVGIGVAGFVLVVIAIILMVESNKSVRDATVTAAKVAAV